MEQAVVLVSGGLDSATVLAMARAEGWPAMRCRSITASATAPNSSGRGRVARALGAVEHRIVASTSACSAARRSPIPPSPCPTAPSAGIPVTYVPARNTIMLSLALA